MISVKLKIIIPEIDNTYTCFMCGKAFSQPENLENEFYCSKRCFFKRVYGIIKGWGYEDQVNIYFYFSESKEIPEIYENLLKLTKNQLIFENTKNYYNLLLPNIKGGFSHSQNPI